MTKCSFLVFCTMPVYYMQLRTSVTVTCPTAMSYTQKSMRTHLLDCLVHRKMSVFPGRARRPRVNEISVVHVYLVCKCRLPEEGNMAQCNLCNERFHQTYESIPDEVWIDSGVNDSALHAENTFLTHEARMVIVISCNQSLYNDHMAKQNHTCT